jgi:small conductance mechanosensitive channel
MGFDLESIWLQVQGLVFEYGLKIVGAIVVFIAGRWLVKKITRLVEQTLIKKGVDHTIIPTVKGVVRFGLMMVVIIAIIGLLGIESTGFVAVLGAAGLAIGLALQGSLANIAGGILLLTLKPFKEGDYIEANGVSGSVAQVSIFNTVLKTPDNKTIYLANGALAGSNITNYSEEGNRRLDLVFGIAYSDDFEKAKSILHKIIKDDQRISDEPAPFVRVGNLGASSVDITVRLWVKTPQYWDINFDMIEGVKKAFDSEGVSFPFPQTDVHLFNEN